MDLINRLLDITSSDILNGLPSFDIPEVESLKNNIELNGWHNRETTLQHTAIVFENFLKIVSKETNLRNYLKVKVGLCSKYDLLKLVVIFHDIAKPEVVVLKNAETSFLGHDEFSATKANAILCRFSEVNSIDRQYILYIIKNHGNVHKFLDTKRKGEKSFHQFIKQFQDFSIEMALIGYADILRSYLEVSNNIDYRYRIAFFEDVIIFLFII